MKTKAPKWYLQKRRKRSYKKGIYLIYHTVFGSDISFYRKLRFCWNLLWNKPIIGTSRLKVFPKDIIFFKRFGEEND